MRLLLLGLALWLGAGMAPHGLGGHTVHMVCSAEGGMKRVLTTDDGSPGSHGFGHDCPLCATAWGPATQEVNRRVPADHAHLAILSLPTRARSSNEVSLPPSRAPPTRQA